MARPPKAQLSINKIELEKLMALSPSRKEAADWFDVSESSLERFIKREFQISFDALRSKRFVKTRMAIKRAQIDKALKGDNTMLIWVGKNYLGQADRIEEKVEAKVEDSQVIKEQRDLIEELKQINEKWRK